MKLRVQARTTLVHKKKERKYKGVNHNQCIIVDTCDSLIFVLSEPRSRPPDANTDKGSSAHGSLGQFGLRLLIRRDEKLINKCVG